MEDRELQATELFEIQRKKNKRGRIISALFLLVTTAAILYIFFSANDFDKTMAAITSASGPDLVFALLCLLAYILITPVSLCILCHAKKTGIHPLKSYLIGASEHFFNNITPYQTGAQPFQVYAFSKGKITAAEGTGLVICNYISFLFALNTLILSSLFYYSDFFGRFAKKGILWIPILGIIMNLITLFLFLCLVTCKWVRNGLKRFLRFLCRFRFFRKKLESSIPSFDTYCDNAQLGAKEILRNPVVFLLAVLLRLLALLFYYAIPFFILRSLNVPVSYNDFVYTLLATCFAVNAVVFVPTPGTSGGIEMSFTILFSLFAGFSGAIAAAAAILWRALTYYLLMLISFLQYLAFELIQKREEKKLSRQSNSSSCSLKKE